MAQNYIVSSDVTQILWEKTVAVEPTAVDKYLEQANTEIEDLAIRKDLQISDIATPIHPKLKAYAVNFALRNFASDRIKHSNAQQGSDVYRDLFERSQFLINQDKPDLNSAVITQKNQNSTSRATNFGKFIRG